MSRTAGSAMVWPRAAATAKVAPTMKGSSGMFLFMVGGIQLWQHDDDPIEPLRLLSLTREAFRFRRAVVNPLNSIATTRAAGRDGLPGELIIVAVLNVV